jgi:uncharacterized protein (DUF4213/DUF364 family)
MMIVERLLDELDAGRILQVLIGLRWTAVVAEVDAEKHCGLAATLHEQHDHGSAHAIPQAGELESLTGLELARYIQAEHPTLRSVGAAAINALLPPIVQTLGNLNAEHVISELGREKRVVVIGHFPFITRLRAKVGELYVLEKNPREGDLPADAAPQILPEAEVVAITSMTILNRTLDGLLSLCAPGAFVMLLGPSTPLNPRLFDYGIDMLSGSIVEDIEPVLKCVAQGADFRQVHRAGVRLVTMSRR